VPEIPAGEIDRVVGPLDALEETFRPLVKDLPMDLEPALALGVEEEGQ
jgi:hypothetical protein